MQSQEVFFMPTQYLIPPEVPQVPPYEAQQMAQGLAGDLALFLFPLLVTLDRLLDKRLVLTFLQTIQVILAYRDRVGGLLLSELGGYLLSPQQAKAWEQAPEHPVAFVQVGCAGGRGRIVAAGQRAGAHLAGARRRGASHLGWQ